MAVTGAYLRRSTDSCWAWVVCLSCFLVQFLVAGQLNSFGVLFVALLKQFRRSEAETAWIGSLAGGVTFFLGPVSTDLCARWGCRTVACVGSLLYLAGMGLTSVVDDMPLMYLTYGIGVGTSFSFLYFSAFSAIAVHFSKHLSLANGIACAGGGCGTVALSLLTNTLCTQLGFKMALRLLACSSVPLFLAGLTFTPMDTDCLVEEEEVAKSVQAAKGTPLIQKLLHLLRPSEVFQNKAFTVWTIAMALVLFCYYIPYVYLARLAEDVGIPSSRGAMLVGYCAMAQTAGKVIFGKLADFRALNRLHVTQTALLVIAVATALLPLAQSYSALVTFSLVAGFFDGGFVTMIGLVIHEIVGRQMMAKAFGAMFGVVALPMTVGPPVAGFFYDSLGNYHAVFLLCSGLLAGGICLTFLIPWLLPVQSDAKKPLLLSEVPTKVFIHEDDELKKPASLQRGPTPLCEEFVSNVGVEHRLLLNQPNLEPRPRSFILFSIVSQDNLRDLSEQAEMRGRSRNTSRLSLSRGSACKLDDVKLTSLDGLRPGDGTGGRLVTERQQACSCVSVPELEIAQNSSSANSQEITVDVEAANTFISSYVVSCDPANRDNELDWVEDGGDTRLRSISWNSSGSNISWKSSSQVSDGTNDSGYVEGHMSPYSCSDNSEENSESSGVSGEFSASGNSLQLNPLSDTIDKRACDEIELSSAKNTTALTNIRNAGVANDTPKLNCFENKPAEVQNVPHHDYFSDLMESELEQSTCACSEFAAADSTDHSNVTCTVESPDEFSQTVEVILEQARELEQDLHLSQAERFSDMSTAGLYAKPANFDIYLSLSSETAV